MSVIDSTWDDIVEFTSENPSDDEVIHENILTQLSGDVRLEIETLLGDSYGVDDISDKFVLGDVFEIKICMKDYEDIKIVNLIIPYNLLITQH